MQLFFSILKNDLKLIFRDRSMLIMFFLPFIIVAVCRLGVPIFTEMIPQLPHYYWLILAGFTSIAASVPSFLFGFVLLDERDENIHNILRILPLPENFILKSRILFIVFSGFIFSLFILVFNGLIKYNPVELIVLAVLFHSSRLSSLLQ